MLTVYYLLITCTMDLMMCLVVIFVFLDLLFVVKGLDESICFYVLGLVAYYDVYCLTGICHCSKRVCGCLLLAGTVLTLFDFSPFLDMDSITIRSHYVHLEKLSYCCYYEPHFPIWLILETTYLSSDQIML